MKMVKTGETTVTESFMLWNVMVFKVVIIGPSALVEQPNHIILHSIKKVLVGPPFDPDWTISTSIRCIAMKFCSSIHGS